jgi:hypothetical protein
VGFGAQQLCFTTGLQHFRGAGLQQLCFTGLPQLDFALRQPPSLPPNSRLNKPASAELPDPSTRATAPNATIPTNTRLIAVLSFFSGSSKRHHGKISVPHPADVTVGNATGPNLARLPKKIDL